MPAIHSDQLEDFEAAVVELHHAQTKFGVDIVTVLKG